MKKNCLLFLLIPFLGFTQNTSQNPLEGLWRIDNVIGLYPTDEYTLSKPKEKEIRDNFIPEDTKDEIPNKYIYGTSVNFNSNNSFGSEYFAWCGNDCFSSSKGTFELIDSTHIRLKVELIRVDGMCQNSIDSTYRDLGIFLIKKQENGYKLIRCLEKESDTQYEKYSEMANNLPRINMNDPSYKEVKLAIKTRKKKDIEILKTGLKQIPGFDLDKVQLLYTTYPSTHASEKRFVFKYQDKLLVAIYYAGSLQFILYDI